MIHPIIDQYYNPNPYHDPANSMVRKREILFPKKDARLIRVWRARLPPDCFRNLEKRHTNVFRMNFLPNEILLHILRYVAPSDHLSFALTSHRFHIMFGECLLAHPTLYGQGGIGDAAR